MTPDFHIKSSSEFSKVYFTNLVVFRTTLKSFCSKKKTTMVSILAILTVVVAVAFAPTVSAQEDNNAAIISASINVTIQYSRGWDGVNDAFAKLQEFGAQIGDASKTAIANIDAGAKTANQKFQSYLRNLKAEIQSAKTNLPAQTKAELAKATDIIRQHATSLGDMLNAGVRDLLASGGQLDKRAAQLKQQLQDAFVTITEAINNDAGFKDTALAEEILAGIQNFNGSLESGALLKYLEPVAQQILGITGSSSLTSVLTNLMMHGATTVLNDSGVHLSNNLYSAANVLGPSLSNISITVTA